MGFGYRRLPEVVCPVAGSKLTTVGAGRGKLAPPTWYGLVAKNCNGQFTARTSKGASNTLIVPATSKLCSNLSRTGPGVTAFGRDDQSSRIRIQRFGNEE